MNIGGMLYTGLLHMLLT